MGEKSLLEFWDTRMKMTHCDKQDYMNNNNDILCVGKCEIKWKKDP